MEWLLQYILYNALSTLPIDCVVGKFGTKTASLQSQLHCKALFSTTAWIGQNLETKFGRWKWKNTCCIYVYVCVSFFWHHIIVINEYYLFSIFCENISGNREILPCLELDGDLVLFTNILYLGLQYSMYL